MRTRIHHNTLKPVTQSDEKQIMSVLGSQILLTLGTMCTLSLSAFHLGGLICSHDLQGLGQSELRGQGRGTEQPWPSDDTEAQEMHQLSVSFLGFLF